MWIRVPGYGSCKGGLRFRVQTLGLRDGGLRLSMAFRAQSVEFRI